MPTRLHVSDTPHPSATPSPIPRNPRYSCPLVLLVCSTGANLDLTTGVASTVRAPAPVTAGRESEARKTGHSCPGGGAVPQWHRWLTVRCSGGLVLTGRVSAHSRNSQISAPSVYRRQPNMVFVYGRPPACVGPETALAARCHRCRTSLDSVPQLQVNLLTSRVKKRVSRTNFALPCQIPPATAWSRYIPSAQSMSPQYHRLRHTSTYHVLRPQNGALLTFF